MSSRPEANVVDEIGRLVSETMASAVDSHGRPLDNYDRDHLGRVNDGQVEAVRCSVCNGEFHGLATTYGCPSEFGSDEEIAAYTTQVEAVAELRPYTRWAPASLGGTPLNHGPNDECGCRCWGCAQPDDRHCGVPDRGCSPDLRERGYRAAITTHSPQWLRDMEAATLRYAGQWAHHPIWLPSDDQDGAAVQRTARRDINHGYNLGDMERIRADWHEGGQILPPPSGLEFPRQPLEFHTRSQPRVRFWTTNPETGDLQVIEGTLQIGQFVLSSNGMTVEAELRPPVTQWLIDGTPALDPPRDRSGITGPDGTLVDQMLATVHSGGEDVASWAWMEHDEDDEDDEDDPDPTYTFDTERASLTVAAVSEPRPDPVERAYRTLNEVNDAIVNLMDPENPLVVDPLPETPISVSLDPLPVPASELADGMVTLEVNQGLPEGFVAVGTIHPDDLEFGYDAEYANQWGSRRTRVISERHTVTMTGDWEFGQAMQRVIQR